MCQHIEIKLHRAEQRQWSRMQNGKYITESHGIPRLMAQLERCRKGFAYITPRAMNRHLV